MIISWIIYLAVAAACGTFFILYKDLLALTLFISVLVIPIVMFVMHLISFLLTKIEVSVDDKDANIDKPIKILIKIKNSSPFSATHIKVTALCKNLFLSTEHECKFVVSSSAFSQKQFSYEIKTEHVGKIEFTMKKAVFYDFLSLFRLTKRTRITTHVPIIPQRERVSLAIRPNNFFAGESDIYSNVKAGDDPSQVFNIREYVEGDKLNRIHWKLTSKTEKYMVKEYSLPVSENLFFYLDLSIENSSQKQLNKVNTLIKTFVSISDNLAKNNITHKVGWYSKNRQTFVNFTVKDRQDVYSCLNEIFSDCIFVGEERMETCEYFDKNRFSHIVLLTAYSVKQIERKFSVFETHNALQSVVVVASEENKHFASSPDVSLVPVLPGKEASCLANVEL